MRAGAYLRVSDAPGGVTASTDRQRSALGKDAAEYGWTVDSRFTYLEPDRSASRFARRAREEWLHLREDVEAGRLGIVMLWESSRGSRELEDWAGFLNLCRKTGTRIWVHTHERLYKLSNYRDFKQLAQEGIDSATESELISIRAKDGHYQAADAGRPHGRIRYGYMRRYELNPPGSQYKHRIIQEVHPVRGPIARGIIEDIAAGVALSAVAERLFREGITGPTGKGPWRRFAIRDMVVDGWTYIAKREHISTGPDGQKVRRLLDGDWPALVDEPTFYKARAVLLDPARKVTAHHNGGGIRPGAVKRPLSYAITCGNVGCGHPVRAVNMRLTRAWWLAGSRAMWGEAYEPYETVPHYRCARNHAGCVYAPAAWCEWLVSGAVASWGARDGVYVELTAGDDAEVSALDGQIASARRQLADFQAEARRTRSVAVLEVVRGIEADIAEMEARARDLAGRSATADLVGGPREDILARFLAMPAAVQKHVVQTLCAPVLLPQADLVDSPWRLSMNFRDQPA